MLELLDRGRTSAPQGVARDLSEREHDLRALIGELSLEADASRGLMTIRGPAPGAESTASSEALSGAREAYAELMLEMRERAPRQAEMILPGTANWRDVARRLGSRTSFIEYLVTDSASIAFVISSDTLAAVDLGIRRTDLARLVQFARGLIAAPERSGDTQWQGPLRRLHQHLVAPLESAGLLDDVERLVIVPHVELHYLPFAALVDERGGFLVQRYAIAMAPSASVWLELGDRPSRATSGVLAFAPKPEGLPASVREAAAVAALSGPAARALTGAAASEDAFRRMAADQSVLHLATYGVLNRHNPLFSFVDLGPGSEHDGRLEVHEVFGLELAAELVVLSACETALGSGALSDVPEGDDWVGLTRAFLHAGASRVVATLWAVSDAASATLMEQFYRERSRGRSEGEALALAQRNLLGDQRIAHPFYWAGVVLVGEDGSAHAR
jgi:CHAT domain-containing protein